MKKTLLAVTVALTCGLAGAEPSYNNSDLEGMRAHYEGRRATSDKRFPNPYWEMPFKSPRYTDWSLPWKNWEAEYRNYFRRHYHETSLTFKPTLICMHYTVMTSAQDVWNHFANGSQMDAGDLGSVFGHASVQLMIDKDGTVYQLMPLDRRCTGAYGVNHKAISIEMVAATEGDLLSRPRQVFSSFCVVRDLMKKFDIPLTGVIAHYEVSAGKTVVPDYLDYADSVYPDSYPSNSARTDPGPTYMSWLRTYVRRVGPAPPDSPPTPPEK